MIVKETFYRPDEVSREARALPAETYNLARRLRTQGESLFVPIRAMQYLAVLDDDEFIFVDREGGRRIEVSWQGFRPQDRSALDAPVHYEAVYYSGEAKELMRRLQGEFQKALTGLARRKPVSTGRARIIRLGGEPS